MSETIDSVTAQFDHRIATTDGAVWCGEVPDMRWCVVHDPVWSLDDTHVIFASRSGGTLLCEQHGQQCDAVREIFRHLTGPDATGGYLW